MIATILPSSTSFHAVRYNEHKVSKGVAHLLEIKNFGAVEMLSRPTAADLTAYLQNYSARNSRIRKAQFHVAISCKGHEKTEEELLDFAHDYMREMGYSEPGQPMLIYAHTDTANTHIHIVTSRVAPDGKKIDHNHERVRSQQVLDRLLGTDRKNKTELDLKEACSYKFTSLTQFKALLNSMGYECYEKDGTVSIKKGGTVLKKVLLADIAEKYQERTFDKKRRRQLRAILKKYRDASADRGELASVMKRKFGIDLVFFGRSDSPYGYMIIDHNTKSVMNGGKILPIKELLDFATPDERFSRIDALIDSLLTSDPKMNIAQINAILSRQFKAYVKGGEIHRAGDSRPLKAHMWETLKRNNRISWVESFHPATDTERDFLCRIGKIPAPGLVNLSPMKTNTYHNRLSDLQDIFSSNPGNGYIPRQTFRNAGFRITDIDGDMYAVDFRSHVMINLNAEGFDTSRLIYDRNRYNRKNHRASTIKPASIRPLRDAGAGRGDNREWEVGYKGDYDRIDDESNLKR